MSRALTQEEYVAGCHIAHNNFYKYTKTVYLGGKSKVIITCPLHGDFTQLAESHKLGHGCTACARVITEASTRITPEEFNLRVSLLDSIYDFSDSKYKNLSTRVDVICPLHGKFRAFPATLYDGGGCKKCRSDKIGKLGVSNTYDFVHKAKEVKGDLYDYEKVVYINNRTKVTITCKMHGDFEQSPDNHLMGAGCPTCGKSGYNENKPGILYILHSGDTTKVGITNRTPEVRAKEVGNQGGPDFNVVSSFYFKCGKTAKKIELIIKRYLKDVYSQPSMKFQGSTECFLNVDIPTLLAFVTPLASN